jgi:hypothetical protein
MDFVLHWMKGACERDNDYDSSQEPVGRPPRGSLPLGAKKGVTPSQPLILLIEIDVQGVTKASQTWHLAVTRG